MIPLLSVIIPTLNEGRNIERLLDELLGQEDVSLEIIVADGGSSDKTREKACRPGVRLVTSAPGRGCQMNAGAGTASGDWLLFLHADSSLTDSSQLARSIAVLSACATEKVAGHYPLHFQTRDPGLSRQMRFFEEKSRLNRAGTWNGDQGLMIAADLFRLTGGFTEKLPFLEDQEFGRRFASMGRFITLPDSLITSARRFEQEGFRERVTLNAMIMGMFHLSHEGFFDKAPGVYQANDGTSRLLLLPFYSLVRRAVFDQGAITGLKRCYVIGQYTAENLWQASFRLGVAGNRTSEMLDRHDRCFEPLLNNPFGYLLGMLLTLSWFHFTELALLIRRGRSRE